MELPEWLTEPLGWVGLTWPEADEELLFQAGQQWIAFGGQLRMIGQTADRAAGGVWGRNEGEAVDAFRSWWTGDSGPHTRLDEDAVAAEVIGCALILFAGATLALKIAFIAQLTILAVEVAQAIATAVATVGATTAEIPGFIAVTRLICRQLVKQVVDHIQTVLADLFGKAKSLLKRVESKLARRAAREASGGAARAADAVAAHLVRDPMSDAERRLLGKEVKGMSPLKPGEHVNDAYVVEFTDGTRAVYKPNVVENEFVSVRSSIPESELAQREVAASRLDEELGFNLVPTTTGVNGPHGPGSLQAFVEDSTRTRPAGLHPSWQEERMGVLDYVIGNTDRHGDNYLSLPDGRLAAIDHGYSFPESNAEHLRSPFVDQYMGRPLSADVMDRVNSVDPAQVADRLRASGLSDRAVDGAMARLHEIRNNGMITGEAWKSFRPVSSGW